MPMKLYGVVQMLADSIKLSWNFLFVLFQAQLSLFVLYDVPVIIKSSPSENLMKENGILHKINEIIKLNSSSNPNGCILFLSLILINRQTLSSKYFSFWISFSIYYEHNNIW